MRNSRKRNTRKAFTMIELMAMLIIIGLLGTLVATKVLKHIDRARYVTTRANLRTLHDAVSQFYMDTHDYPTEEEGLQILVDPMADIEGYDSEGYLERTEIPKDGWQHEFIYERDPEQNIRFRVKSCGPDGQEGTDDDMFSTEVD